MLEMQDRTKVATGLESAVEESETDRTEASLVLQRTKREFENWQPNLPEVRFSLISTVSSLICCVE